MRGIHLTAIHPEIGFVRLAAAGVEDGQGSLVGVQDGGLQQSHFAGFRECYFNFSARSSARKWVYFRSICMVLCPLMA